MRTVESFIPCLSRAAAVIVLCASPFAVWATTVRHEPWGQDPAGKPVELYTLEDGDAKLSVATYGARVISIFVPDRSGTISDVVITRNAADQYQGPLAATGATIGRYANRIAGASLALAGTSYSLNKNNGPNTLHGGVDGFSHRTWSAQEIKEGVRMTLVSPDGDMGFPGELTVQVSFTLRHRKKDAVLRISYTAVTTKLTVANLTNHAYFNLANDPATPVLEDKAHILADSYTPVDEKGVPLGNIAPVAGTPFDFRQPRALGDNIPAQGYDNNFALRPHELKSLAAQVDDPRTGRSLKVYTSEPGLQLFVPYALPNAGPNAKRPRVEAFCLETQHFPDSPHHPDFPTTELKPGQTFSSETMYVFGVSSSKLP